MLILKDIRIIFSIFAGEIYRFIEANAIKPSVFASDKRREDLFRGRVLIDAVAEDSERLTEALNCVEKFSPIVVSWLLASITVIKVGKRHSSIGAFHPTGALIGVTKQEVLLSKSEIACILARRIKLAKVARKKRFILPFRLVQIYVSILFFEYRLASKIGVNINHSKQIDRRINFWLSLLDRWKFFLDKRSKKRVLFLRDRLKK